MISTGAVLKDTLNKLGLDSKIKSHQIWYIWDKAVGPHISNVAQPEDIKGKTLFVNVKDNIWLRQLKFLESMMIDKLNNTIGETVLNKIYFKLGEIRQSPVTSYQSPVISKLKTNDCRLPTDIDLSPIKDADLRKTIQRIALKTNAAKRT